MDTLILFLLIISSIVAMSMAIAGLSLAPWVPTRKRDLARIFKLIELSFPMFLICQIRKTLSKNKNAHFKFKNAHEMKPGSRLISCAFEMKGWEPNAVHSGD